MENHEDNRWLDAIDSTYTPKMREIIIPDASGLTPRPFWRRSVSIVLAAFVVVLASVVLSLGL
ncbi:MAG: hypothetical protein VX210_07025 [Myxococcota bacterium]|nr:hypothetical protein [Myxococcota bacterium]